MMHSVNTHQNEGATLPLTSLFTAIGDFAFRGRFKALEVTPELYAKRLQVLSTIAYATEEEWIKITQGQRKLMLAILRYESRRLEGTWVGEEGRTGKLRFETAQMRDSYRKRLAWAISECVKHQL